MSDPYVGEIRMFGGNFAPVGWALCQGQLQSISDNPALFQLLGTTYGGDGVQTFALPNLQGRVPVHAGPSFIQGQLAGSESVTLTTNTIPSHNHAPAANTSPSGSDPTNAVLAASGGGKTFYTQGQPGSLMNASMVKFTGGTQPHDNMVPFLCVNFIIALVGVFPTQS